MAVSIETKDHFPSLDYRELLDLGNLLPPHYSEFEDEVTQYVYVVISELEILDLDTHVGEFLSEIKPFYDIRESFMLMKGINSAYKVPKNHFCYYYYDGENEYLRVCKIKGTGGTNIIEVATKYLSAIDGLPVDLVQKKIDESRAQYDSIVEQVLTNQKTYDYN